MNWIAASIFMVIASNVYYLTLRCAQKAGIHTKYYMVANFSIPPLLYYILGTRSELSFSLPLPSILIIFFTAFFLSYIPASISYIAMKKAPNAGYSVIIQKSYAVYTSIAAVFLFQAPLPLYKFGAILFVLLCTAIVSGIGEKSNATRVSGYGWVFLSLLAFFGFGTLRLAGKYMIDSGIPVFVYLAYLHTCVAFISFVDLLHNRKKVKLLWNVKNVRILAGIGFSVAFFNYFLQVAEVTAPNIGFASAINVASNAIYTVLVALIFKDAFSTRRFLGVLGVVAGILILLF